MIDSIPTPMVYVDSGQRYRYVNDAFLNFVNGRRERIIGRQVREVLGPERHDALEPDLERVLAGETVTITQPSSASTAAAGWMHIRYTPRRDAYGRVLGYYTTTSDIHEQKAVEEELRRANSILFPRTSRTRRSPSSSGTRRCASSAGRAPPGRSSAGAPTRCSGAPSRTGISPTRTTRPP